MAREKLGDIFEIDTPKGKAYLHYIYLDPNPKMGFHLLRVLPGLHKEKPENADALAELKEQFMFFSLYLQHTIEKLLRRLVFILLRILVSQNICGLHMQSGVNF
jgi:hypothetical protein